MKANETLPFALPYRVPEGWTCKELVLPIGPHPGVRLALWLLMRFGSEVFPGVSRATPRRFVKAGRFTPDGRSWQEWFQEGTLAIGVWGGHFHWCPKESAGPLCDSAHLMALALGVSDRPTIKPILGFTLQDTRMGGRREWDISTTLDRMFRTGASEDLMQTWFDDAIDAVYLETFEVLSTVAELKVRPPQVRHVMSRRDGNVYHVVSVDSDSKVLQNVLLRNPKLCVCAQCDATGLLDHDVVIQRSGRRVAIFARSGIRLDQFVARWRQFEAGRRAQLSQVEAESDGALDVLPDLFFQANASRVFWGSLRNNPDRPPKAMKGDILERELCELLADRSSSPSKPQYRRRDVRQARP